MGEHGIRAFPRPVRIALAGRIDPAADQPDVAQQVIPRDHPVVQAERDVWNGARLVRVAGNAIERRGEFIREPADPATLKRREMAES
jgi:hypothetical protein